MVTILINVVVTLLILGIIWWVVETTLPLIPMPGPIATIVRVLLVAILAIILIYTLLPLLHLAGAGHLGCY